MSENTESTPPVIHAGASPLNGVVPPLHRRWKKGESGNPAGRPPAGLSWLESVNLMAGWPESRVKLVASDRKASIAHRAAAKDLLRWCAAGKRGDTVGSNVADRILDRTVGKPLHRTEHIEAKVEIRLDFASLFEVDRQYNGQEVLELISSALAATLPPTHKDCEPPKPATPAEIGD